MNLVTSTLATSGSPPPCLRHRIRVPLRVPERERVWRRAIEACERARLERRLAPEARNARGAAVRCCAAAGAAALVDARAAVAAAAGSAALVHPRAANLLHAPTARWWHRRRSRGTQFHRLEEEIEMRLFGARSSSTARPIVDPRRRAGRSDSSDRMSREAKALMTDVDKPSRGASPDTTTSHAVGARVEARYRARVCLRRS